MEKGKGKAHNSDDSKRRVRVRIKAPELDTSRKIKENELTLIGRVTNPQEQEISTMIPFLTRHWNLKGRSEGSDLGEGRFQFRFEREDDLQQVLENRPYTFAQWMVILEKWEPVISSTFPSKIPFWIRLKGLPLHYWQEEMVNQIGEEAGRLDGVEITTTYARARVTVHGLQPILRETVVEFPNGDEVTVRLDYERLEKFCNFCDKLTHEDKDCPDHKRRERTRIPNRFRESSNSSKTDLREVTVENAARSRRVSQGETRHLIAASSRKQNACIFQNPPKRGNAPRKGQTLAIEARKNSSAPSSSSSPQSSLPSNRIHDVFPSFHGPDVRTSFLSHIIKEFRRKGINTFIDNEIKRGEFIGHELKTAIQGSKIAIVLLSKNYASSSWCLDELVEIMTCKKDLGQKVMTIFYEVDPTDVKKQTGYFGKVFQETCKGKTKQKSETWRNALEGVATIAGYHLRNWDNEAAMIEEISTHILKILNHLTPSCDFERYIGMGARVEKMKPLLRMDSDEVRMIGIWGPPGIGKSTIARFIFNKLYSSFQLRANMVNIKECYREPCLDEYNAQLQLQSQMLSQMINQKDVVISHLGVAQERLNNKKVLLVLDDVDRLAQLDALAKDIKWFGSGSRIIIATQDLRVLRAHGINDIYTVDLPSDNDALQIFCMSAFGHKFPKDGFRELAWQIVSHAGKLPLGLEVMGSYFRNMSKQEWKKALPKLWSSLDGKIESIFKFSYDALDYDDKYLFLHIACLFVNEEAEHVEEYLAKRFPCVSQGLDILVEKSLIYMDDGWVRMHDLLVKFGREIVRKQSENPGKRQFLVHGVEISEVLEDDAAGSENVIGINFYALRSELNMSERAFEGMSNLQFLKIKGGDSLHLPHGLSYLSPKLRLLDWSYFPRTCLPSNINMKFLVELKLRQAKHEKLWVGIKQLPNLKWMDLSYLRNLVELPNLSTATNLQTLNLHGCSSLVELPNLSTATNLQELILCGCSSLVELPNLSTATNLHELNLNGCSSLVELPNLSTATNLQKLFLSGCSSLVELPNLSTATNLQELILYGCSSLVELPNLSTATNLQRLNLRGCLSLVELPNLSTATNLHELNLNGCSSLVELPNLSTNLQELDLSGCSSLVELPNLSTATNLKRLNLNGCSSLVELPNLSTNLQELDLSGCSSLVELPNLSTATNLQTLNLRGCSSLVELPNLSTNLQELILCECSSLVELPNLSTATNLKRLNLRGCLSLVELPNLSTNLHELIFGECSSLVELPNLSTATNLKRLNLNGCSSLVELPNLSTATNLQELILCGCSSLVEIPNLSTATNLQKLNLSGCSSLVELPNLSTATNLKRLNLRGCLSLVELPNLSTATNLHELIFGECLSLVELPNLSTATNLKRLNLSGCSSLVELPNLSTNLQELDLSGCSSLVELPNLSTATNLQTLNLSGCSSLVELPNLSTNLQELDLSRCSSLVELPNLSTATNLQTLNLRGCSSLVELPNLSTATNLQRLNLSGCSSLVELPNLSTNLQELDLSGCSSLVELPNLSTATNLQTLNLSGCSSLVELPNLSTNLQELDLSRCSSLVELPNLSTATNLQTLNLRGCSSLVELPNLSTATNLQRLNLSGCSSLVELPNLSTNLQELDLSGCSSLVELPNLSTATNLQTLNLRGCSSLVELPNLSTNLQELILGECSSLVELPNLSTATNLQELILCGCSSLVELPNLPAATNLQRLNLRGCSSLVELPSSIGNLHQLKELTMKGCSKLEVLPINVNLKFLDKLNLNDCSSLKSFPEISTNIRELDLRGTAIEEVPSSIRSWSRLEKLDMSGCKNLKKFAHGLESITERGTKIQDVSPLVQGCKKLVSLPPLPDSVEQLEYRSFCSPFIQFNFSNCFKLYKEARDFIIQKLGRNFTVVPGKEIPTYFTYRANGGSLIVKLKEGTFPSSLKFKACILLLKNNDVEARYAETEFFDYSITVKMNSVLCRKGYSCYIPRPLTEHLYIFEYEADVTSNEISFEFSFENFQSNSDELLITECGCIPEKEE